MKTMDKKRKGIRWGLIVLIVLLLVLACTQLFFVFYLDSYVENQLISAISKQTSGQYELTMDDLNLSVLGRTLQADNISLHPVDTTSTALKVVMKQLSMNQIHFFNYLFSGSIHVGGIQLRKPEVSIVQDSSDSLYFLKSSETSSSSVQKKMPAIEFDQFSINHGSTIYWTSDQSEIRGELNDFNLDLTNIVVDSTTISSAPYFQFDSFQASSGDILYNLNNELYTLETSGFDFSTDDKFVSVDSLKLIPKYPKYEFSQSVGRQLDRLDLMIAQLLFENPDIEKLMHGEFIAGKFTIRQANLEVFHDKTLPIGPQENKAFPHLAFRNLSIPITIDTVSIQHSKISYEERRPNVTRSGKVSFSNLNGTLSGVTNDSLIISQGHEIALDVTTEVMEDALLDAHFIFPMQKNGEHSVRGTLESMNVEKLNPILEPVGLVRAKSGTIHSLDFSMDLGKKESSGWVQLVYSDLKIEVLDEENVDDGGRKKFKSFLANALKIKSNNNHEPFRRGNVSFERIEKKSVFSYWWKSLSSGLKDNIGL